MTIVDHMEQDIGGVLSVSEISNFIDDQDVGMRVGLERVLQLPLPAGIGEIFDQFCGSREVSFEAILDGAITDGDCQMGFTPAGLPVQDQGATLGDEVQSQVGTEQCLTERRIAG